MAKAKPEDTQEVEAVAEVTAQSATALLEGPARSNGAVDVVAISIDTEGNTSVVAIRRNADRQGGEVLFSFNHAPNQTANNKEAFKRLLAAGPVEVATDEQ